MTLKKKLVISFMLMLSLTVFTAFTGWRSMERMDVLAGVANTVENSLIAMLLSQNRLLSYLNSNDPAQADSVRSALTEGQNYLQSAMAHLTRPENRQLATNCMKYFDEFPSILDKFMDNKVKIAAILTSMDEVTDQIQYDFMSLEDNLRSLTSADFNDDIFNAYNSIHAANQAYLRARLSAGLFLATPSEDNAETAMMNFVEAITKTEEAAELMVFPHNVKMAKGLVTSIDVFQKQFPPLRAVINDNADLTETVHLRLQEGLSAMRILTKNVMHVVTEAKNTGNQEGVIVTGVAVLLGLCIALLLSRNVHMLLGKDPAALADIARRVTTGDHNIDDGSPRTGVYGSILDMVESLRTLLGNARHESERARAESERAREAMEQAHTAGQEAEAKAHTLLQAADRLGDVAAVLSSASEQLAAQLAQSETGATHQAGRVNETVQGIHAMKDAVRHMAESAVVAADVSTATKRKAEIGAHVVQEAVHSIAGVQSSSARLKNDMLRLEENSQAIARIMGVISDIADQTNLLALNAAIEAARAGEAGRGFAVVADEVRKLAEKTMASTEDVGRAVRGIQDSTVCSIKQMDEAVDNISKATILAQRSGEALNEIVHMMDTNEEQVRAISAAAEDQAHSVDGISASIDDVRSIADDTVTNMREAATAVRDLSTQAQVLHRLIESMK